MIPVTLYDLDSDTTVGDNLWFYLPNRPCVGDRIQADHKVWRIVDDTGVWRPSVYVNHRPSHYRLRLFVRPVTENMADMEKGL